MRVGGGLIGPHPPIFGSNEMAVTQSHNESLDRWTGDIDSWFAAAGGTGTILDAVLILPSGERVSVSGGATLSVYAED